MNIAVTALPIATLLAYLTPYVRWNTVYCPPETDIFLELESLSVWLRLFRASFVLSSLLITGATVCLELAMHYGALGEWSNTLENRLTAFAVIIALISLIDTMVRLCWIRRWCNRQSMLVGGYHFHRSWKVTAVLLLSSFSWGVSYHTLAYYLRRYILS
jgi:hypothetical protein